MKRVEEQPSLHCETPKWFRNWLYQALLEIGWVRWLKNREDWLKNYLRSNHSQTPSPPGRIQKVYSQERARRGSLFCGYLDKENQVNACVLNIEATRLFFALSFPNSGCFRIPPSGQETGGDFS